MSKPERPILRDYVNATIGFEKLAAATEKSPKSVMRMLDPKGNPHANNLFEIISHLQKRGGVELKIGSR